MPNDAVHGVAWDERDISVCLLDAALHVRRTCLTDSRDEPRDPGVYMVFYSGRLSWYREVGDGHYPVYVGSAQDLGERLRRHQRNSRPVRNLHAGSDLWVSSIPLESHAGAVYAEELLIKQLNPVWNQRMAAGFGSRFQGRSRTGQRPPPWSLLHPGRRVGDGEAAVSVEFLGRKVSDWLERHTRSGIWDGIA